MGTPSACPFQIMSHKLSQGTKFGHSKVQIFLISSNYYILFCDVSAFKKLSQFFHPLFDHFTHEGKSLIIITPSCMERERDLGIGSCTVKGWYIQNLHGTKAGWRLREDLNLYLKTI